MFEKRGLQKLAGREYEEAEKFLCKAVSLRKPFSKSTTSLEHIKANLADCYCQQAKWEDADRLLSGLSDSRNKLDILALHSLHAVSHIYFGKVNLDAADRTCRKALLGKKKLLGKTHESYYHTLLLLACICDARGDEVQGDGWRHFLPASLESRSCPVPLDHQLRPKTVTPSHLLEIPRSPVVQPIPKAFTGDKENKQPGQGGIKTPSAAPITDQAFEEELPVMSSRARKHNSTGISSVSRAVDEFADSFEELGMPEDDHSRKLNHHAGESHSLSIRRKPLDYSTLDGQEATSAELSADAAPTIDSGALAAHGQAIDLKSLMPYFFDETKENRTQVETVKPLRYASE